MSLESSIFDALKSLVSNRVYPDVAPENAVRPYITYQQVGGEGVNFVDSTTPSLKNARMQINVWADTRAAAATLAGQVETAIRNTTAIHPKILGAPVAMFDLETKLRGTRQDFSVWG